MLPRPNCLLRSGKMDVSRRKTFEWILVLGYPSFSMVAAVAPMPMASRTRLVAVLSEKTIMRRTASRSLNVVPSEKWYGQDSRSRHLVLFSEGDDGVEVDLPGSRLAIRFDHDRELDQAGRRHDDGRLVNERLACLEVLDRDGDLSFVRIDERHQP